MTPFPLHQRDQYLAAEQHRNRLMIEREREGDIRVIPGHSLYEPFVAAMKASLVTGRAAVCSDIGLSWSEEDVIIPLMPVIWVASRQDLFTCGGSDCLDPSTVALGIERVGPVCNGCGVVTKKGVGARFTWSLFLGEMYLCPVCVRNA